MFSLGDDEIAAECSYCKNIVGVENISSHQKTCEKRPIDCPGCSKVVLLENLCDHECQKPNVEGMLIILFTKI